MTEPRLLFVLGTRPEAIKLGPVIAACRRRLEWRTIVCLTGQHRELLEPLIGWFDLRPDVDLALMEPDQTPAALAGKGLSTLAELIAREQPSLVVAQGDTSSVLAAAIAAFLQRVPLVHVEAGLRTDRLDAPWPEEFNRRVASLAATLHCAPTERAAARLLAEHVDPARIRVTGNSVVDALLWTRGRLELDSHAQQHRYAGLEPRRFILATAHRREHLGLPLERVCAGLAQLAQERKDLQIVVPLHLNPRVRSRVIECLRGLDNVRLIEPVDYVDFVWLLGRAALVVSDSGGIQEEVPSLGTPLLVTRDTTERPEALTTGRVELVGAQGERLLERARHWLTLIERGEPLEPVENPFGDGRAAVRITDWIAEYLAETDSSVR